MAHTAASVVKRATATAGKRARYHHQEAAGIHRKHVPIAVEVTHQGLPAENEAGCLVLAGSMDAARAHETAVSLHDAGRLT